MRTRWIELIDAARLERRFSKDEIFEFYLNQVPFAHEVRGMVSESEALFDRSLSLLTKKELLCLAVLIRAPSGFEPVTPAQKRALERRVIGLAKSLLEQGELSQQEFDAMVSSEVRFSNHKAGSVPAEHFLQFVARTDTRPRTPSERIRTTLDSETQRKVSAILKARLQDMKSRNVSSGAVLAVDNESGEVRVWAGESTDRAVREIDPILTPRQPGSALKPFLYTIALEKGWTASTILDDAPLAKAVGIGLKQYRNYSGTHYGPIPLRAALGNSLNIPAIETIDFIGRDTFYRRLHALGFTSLVQSPDFYGDGLALGNGEVTLYELVRAYLVLANRGRSKPIKMIDEPVTLGSFSNNQLFSEDAVSLMGHILSDPYARRLEFGVGSLLSFPVQTAVKTGTSTDYCDAWAVGYSARYTVGVWMGNLNRSPMIEITGSLGPALILRAVFAELERKGDSRPLYLSPNLVQRKICRITGKLAGDHCPTVSEWYRKGAAPTEPCTGEHEASTTKKKPQDIEGPHIVLPTPGLRLAKDPRIPDELQMFPLTISTNRPPQSVSWIVDGSLVSTTGEGITKFLWPVSRGDHEVKASIVLGTGHDRIETDPIRFYVR